MLLPVALNVEGRAVLIVGGGGVAARKAAAFLGAGAHVTVISPALNENFPQPVQHCAKGYEDGDLEGFSLALVCTNSRQINAAVTAEAKERGVWCNVANAPQESDFHTVSVIRRGEIAVGVSTGGASPVLARFVRQKVEESLPQEMATFLEIAGSYHIATEIRGDFWRQVLQSEILSLLNSGLRDEAIHLFEKTLRDVSKAAQPS